MMKNRANKSQRGVLNHQTISYTTLKNVYNNTSFNHTAELA